MASANAPNRTPAFSRVLYVTNAANDQWFIPTTGYGDNPASGTMAQRQDQCEDMVGKNADGSADIGKAVKEGSLADW